MIQLDGRHGLRPAAFVARMNEVRAGEPTDAAGRGVRVLVCARDWTFVRLVVHHGIDDEQAALVGQKIVYAIGEWERELAAQSQ